MVRLRRHLSPSASTDPTPSTRPVEPAPVERLLFATSSKTAWRATVGDCDTPGEIERSTNGGASWKRIVRTGPAPIVQLGAEPSGNVFAIGGTRQSCSVRYVAYANDGTVTASTARPVNVWFPTPKDRDEINGPGGTKATPCNGHVMGLAALNLSRALVVCDDGAAMSTGNSGKTWRQAARLPNTLAITAGSDRYWVAGAHKDCDGVTVQSLDRKKRQPDARRNPLCCLASMSLLAKWQWMSPATQSGFGVATESPSHSTMAKRGSDEGRSDAWLNSRISTGCARSPTARLLGVKLSPTHGLVRSPRWTW